MQYDYSKDIETLQTYKVIIYKDLPCSKLIT